MAFDKKTKIEPIKEIMEKSSYDRTLIETRSLINHHISSLEFKANEGDVRTYNNCQHILSWLKMPLDSFRKVKHPEFESGALKDRNTIIIPEDQNGQRLEPTLLEVVYLREEEMDKVDFAKKKEVEALEKIFAEK